MLRNHQQTQIGCTSRSETILCVNVAFFYNNFDQFLPIVMTFTAGYQSSSLTLIYGLAAANGISSFYLDILRLVNALYEMVLTRATLNLITQRPLKMFFSIIFTDNKTSSIVSYES